MNNTFSATSSRPSIRQTQQWSVLVFRLLDAVSIAYGVFFVTQWFPDLDSKATLVSSLVAFAVFSFVAELLGLYRDWSSLAFAREAGCSILTWGCTLVALSAVGHFSNYTTELSGHSLLVWFFVTPSVALALRISFRSLLRWSVDQGLGVKSFAVVGCNDLGISLVKALKKSTAFNLKFKGFYEDRQVERTAELPAEQMQILGTIEQLIADAKANKVNVVFVTLPMRAEERIRNILQELGDSTTSVYIVPDLFVFQLMHSRWTTVEGLPVVSVFENPFYGVDGVFKRMVDLVCGSIALAIFGLPMLAVAVAVKLTSAGPVFFRQKRYGLDGKPIWVWKFRSMTVCENGDKVTQATKNDSRLTPIGGFLRKTSLDELPQLFNVLNGTMSLVGPRPHANAHNEFYRSQITGYMLRHKVKPGITGLAQVCGYRGETDTLDKMEKRIQFDHQYIREWSVWLDLKILFRTVAVVLKPVNAY